MQINFDQDLKIDTQADVNLYGKKVKVAFNDDFRRAIRQARLKIETTMSKFDDEKYVQELSKKSYEEQTKVADNLMRKSREIVFAAVDELLGEGTGKFLYKKFGNSTEAVSAVLGLLEDYADESVKNIKEEKRKRKLAKYKNHH